MQHIFPVNFNNFTPGVPGPWMIDGSSGGCFARGVRLGNKAWNCGSATHDTIVFLVTGKAEARIGGATIQLARESSLLVPAGARAEIKSSDDSWALEMIAPIPEGSPTRKPVAIEVDESKFEGGGFAYQSILDRKSDSLALRMNMLRVTSGSGSPDYHIHVFDQLYFIMEGEMKIDIGLTRLTATAPCLVYLPAGVVHRNFNAGPAIERHVSFLIPEPPAGEILDYGTTIHEREAEIQTRIPEIGFPKKMPNG